MFVRYIRCARSARLLAVFGLGLTGCGAELLSGSNGGTLELVVSEESPSYQETGTNDYLELAERVTLAEFPTVVTGAIRRSDDIDVFDVGPVLPGDRIQVQFESDATLNGTLALFDEFGTLQLINDHRNVYLGLREPFLDATWPRASTACYVAVGASSGAGYDGNYRLVISKSHRQPILPPRSDDVLLVFDGGTGVTIGSRAAIDVPVFDAANIDSSFAGTTGALMALVVEKVRRDYEAYHINIHSTSEGTRFDGSMTRLFFGSFDARLLGVAEGVDEFNLTRGQVAIVFTETFGAFMSIHPTLEEMAQALANVASHEIGHLLGLVHTSDPAGIMDVTGSLRDLVTDQEFRISPLNREVFGLGYQNEARYLLDALGGDAGFAARKLNDEHGKRPIGAMTPSGPPCRAAHVFSSCGLEH